jgi:hypothetical protein
MGGRLATFDRMIPEGASSKPVSFQTVGAENSGF